MVCAEAVALGMAASNGEREYDCIVAVTMAEGKEPHVISPCGACRERVRCGRAGEIPATAAATGR